MRSLTSSCAGLPGQRLLADGGHFTPQVLALVK